MSLKDMIAQDAVNVFCNADDFAEPLIYVKRDGTTRAINGQVFRNRSRIDATGVLRRYTEVMVANDATYGISAAELNVGGDRIRVADREGEAVPTTGGLIIHVGDGEWQDAGMLTLELY